MPVVEASVIKFSFGVVVVEEPIVVSGITVEAVVVEAVAVEVAVIFVDVEISETVVSVVIGGVVEVNASEIDVCVFVVNFDGAKVVVVVAFVAFIQEEQHTSAAVCFEQLAGLQPALSPNSQPFSKMNSLCNF